MFTFQLLLSAACCNASAAAQVWSFPASSSASSPKLSCMLFAFNHSPASLCLVICAWRSLRALGFLNKFLLYPCLLKHLSLLQPYLVLSSSCEVRTSKMMAPAVYCWFKDNSGWPENRCNEEWWDEWWESSCIFASLAVKGQWWRPGSACFTFGSSWRRNSDFLSLLLPCSTWLGAESVLQNTFHHWTVKFYLMNEFWQSLCCDYL